MAKVRILFTEEDFTKLISGEIVKKKKDDIYSAYDIEIALEDIGYDKMMKIILEKYDG